MSSPTSAPDATSCVPTDSQAALLTAVSVLSLCGCLYVIASYLFVPALRQHPAGIMFGMSVYGAVYQFLYLIEAGSVSSSCNRAPFLVDFFLTGQETYMLVFAIDLLLALKNPFSTSKGQMKTYHLAACLWSLIFAAISQCDSHFALFGFCWMDLASTGLKLHTPAPPAGLFFALYILLIYIISLYAILRTWNTLLKGLPDTLASRDRTHRHLKYYVGCFVFYWTGVLVAYAIYTFVSVDASYKCLLWKCLSCLLLAKGMVHSLIWTRTSNILKTIRQLREFGRVDLPPHDNSINWALRVEILTYTTQGICESIERAERQAIDGNTTSSNDRRIKYTQVEEIPLISGNTHDKILFYDYAPHIFRFLRACGGISNASYRNSLHETTNERVSEGKSGAFFYFSQDRKYVVKTLTHEELHFLLEILPKYVTFMSANPSTFVTKFFGCHALTMHGKTVFFIVMQSVFDTRLAIHERFDLKGSWVGRLEGRKTRGTTAICKFCSQEYIIGGSDDQYCNVESSFGQLRHQYDNVGKDLNWNHQLKLPRAVAAQVARQLLTDSTFLKEINCIDYSLLVGIHHRTFHVSPPHVEGGDTTNPFQAHYGGMGVEQVYGPGVYFMGLIDILQRWNLRKRIEHFVRVYLCGQDKHGISVVNPKVYAERFQKRVVRDLICDLQAILDEEQAGGESNHDDGFSSSEDTSLQLNDTFMSVDPVTPRSSLNLFPLLKQTTPVPRASVIASSPETNFDAMHTPSCV
ncbi:hypothetical protein LEN26_000627 [Aphanomyces euteiches]|nr:hypothetical protein AeMF1_002582 [Aphanomyces euteiches]KAH9163134.1 hypothetical protein LEN26_000627 [Aphanomyces euteiches]KAH9191026.1 hypothetical protein AeNC1_007005 [Aphanomyces euteiches]